MRLPFKPILAAALLAVLAIALVLALLITQPRKDGVAGPTLTAKQEEWKAAFARESLQPVQVVAHPAGHLLAVMGHFPLAGTDASNVRAWLMRHANAFGLPDGIELQAIDLPSLAEAPAAAGQALGVFPFRASLHFEASLQGIPFVGKPIIVDFNTERTGVASVFNGFSPIAPGKLGKLVRTPENEAWDALERKLGGPLTRLSATETWFDADWALKRRSGHSDVHWYLQGLTQGGAYIHAFVRSSDLVVSVAPEPSAAFDLPQRHYTKDANGTEFPVWQSSSNVECIPDPVRCTSAMRDDSKDLRVIVREGGRSLVPADVAQSSPPA